MPDALYIDTSGFARITDKLKGMEKEIREGVDQVLNANAIEIAKKAQDLAPVDIGGLRSSIAPETSQLLDKHITVNASYAAYVEFGTGSYAAAYVGSLPDNWRQFAMQFKGKGSGGSAYDLWQALIKWVHSHSQYKEGAVTGTHSEKTGRRKGGKSRVQAEDEAIAYLIMRKILKKGIKKHPFLFPAYEQQRDKIEEDIKTVLKSLS
jgi:HK97 gp10 family phage protein